MQSISRPRVATSPAAGWTPDLGDGSYRNPVLFADYSDPDVTRLGDDYWLTASSFSHVPGLPILHSRDLVNWTLVAHALPKLVPDEVFAMPQHGKGVWAPSIRHHANRFWLYFADPDFGIYLLTAGDPRGPWSPPTLVKGGRGLIDPCPLWDHDGRVYLVHGWAHSRANVKNSLALLELDPTGTRVIDNFGYIINGDRLPGYTTLEGPKFYQRNGWYYVFAPAGGVATGWQSVFRAKNIRGPYEDRIVLAQGSTPINGPHQGALVDTPAGESWFLHFQERGAYGRIVHLQPVRWENDWPLMGTGVVTGATKGEPVLVYPKPNVSSQPVAIPATSDEFDAPALGLQWQWQANPSDNWYSLSASPGGLRLYAQPECRPGNLYDSPHLLLQKFSALEFMATTKFDFTGKTSGDSAGLIVFGYDYAWLGWRRNGANNELVLATRREAAKGEPQEITVVAAGSELPHFLRVTVRDGATCQFSYSVDGAHFTDTGDEFSAAPGRWVGAKLGVFASSRTAVQDSPAHADFDWFRVQAP